MRITTDLFRQIGWKCICHVVYEIRQKTKGKKIQFGQQQARVIPYLNEAVHRGWAAGGP